ncbi:MAG: hypothetical protein FWF46_00850 [Oscillospiraceae bacterium]|nr:hypothetical protein [Oscillospiraceae bacterium]
MRRILIILFLVIIIIGVIIIYILQNKEKVEVADNVNNIINTETNIDEAGYDAYSKIAKEDIIKDYSSTEYVPFENTTIEAKEDPSDNNVLYNQSDYIIIGKIQTIDGGTNYNPKAKIYIDGPSTIGQLKVERVLKGDLEEETIPYIRSGGIITIADYQKGLFPEQYSSKNHWLNKLSEKEKNTKYLKETYMEWELGKTYLMYLTYNDDFKRYSVGYLWYGVREVDVATLGSDSKAIKVKNYETGEWEMLNAIIPNMI